LKALDKLYTDIKVKAIFKQTQTFTCYLCQRNVSNYFNDSFV